MNDVMSPEEYARLLELGTTSNNLADDVVSQAKKAEMLRKLAPNLAPIRNSGKFLTFNPLETVANTFAHQAAMGADAAGGQAMKQINKNTAQQNQMIMSALLRGNQPGMPPQMPMQNPYQQFRIPGGT